ncbi:MAG: hypothetical protein IJ677_04860 [Alphaproteobacteria bacterium]|nr:hypothetical protein [Alphaproteobacteria bacterium]
MKKILSALVNVVITLVVIMASVFTVSCDNEKVASQASAQADTVRIVKGYKYETTLTHTWDSVYKIKVTDQMVSGLKIWRTEGGQKIEPALYDNSERPLMEAHSELAREDYAITESQVNIKPTNSTLLRNQKVEKDGSTTELDTLRFWFEDGQILSIPVTITNKQVKLGDNSVFDFASLTLVKGEFAHLINHAKSAGGATRAAAKQYVSAEYNTEYKTWLTLQETNIENPKTFVVPVYAYTDRRVLSDDNIEKIIIENKNRVWLDTLTERCSFDRVAVYKSGDRVSETKEIVLKHLFKGIDPYDKFVSNFNYAFTSTNGIANGSETSRESGLENWSVWGKTDKYSANVENGVSADKIVTDYSLYHERCIYKEDTLSVEFPFIAPEVQEIQTVIASATSDKSGYKKAQVKNFIGTSYLGGNQGLNELVNIYMSSKDIIGYDIINPSIKVLKDSVICDLDFVTKYEDGTETKVHDHFNGPRTLKCNTNWESIQEILSQLTDTTAVVNMSGSEGKEQGYWRYSNETRNISTYAHLYNGEAKLNSWTSIVPNKISYVREGKSYSFNVLPYSVKEQGAALHLKGEQNGFTVYDYQDLIEENFGGYVQNSSAPGVLKIAADVIKGYEIRNKLLTITPENVTASLDFVTIFSNGREDVEKVSKDFPRSLVCTTDWKSTEKNAEQTTAQPVATVSASQNMTDNNEWSWVNQTRSITATVTLNGSTQYNGWTAVDPNNIKFTRNGITADFGTIKHSTAKVTDNASLKSTVGLTETHEYSNTISVSYGNNMQSTTAPGTIIVNKDKEVTGHEFRNKNLVITNNNVTASLIYVTKYNDGSEDTESVSKSFPRTLNCYTNWSVNETNASVLTGAAGVVLKSSDAKTEGNWSYTAEKRDITTTAQLQNSNQTNGWNALDPNNIKYTREGETCDFGSINFNAAEAGQHVNVTSDTATLTTYSYSDDVTITFGDNVQSISAPGTINVAKAKEIVGYEITNQTLTVNQNDVTASLTFITKWSDGSEDSENISKVFSRNFSVLTNWSSEEENANQNTGSASVTLKNSENKTDGDWSYARETRGISTTATLNGSNQNNGWESIDPNNITFSRNGKTHSFGTINFSATETGANVNKKSETSELTVYDYTDNISVSFGNNSFNSSAPGQIKVSAPWKPDFDHGKFTGCVFTTARNENRTTWVYVMSIHFEKGTLPVVIRRDANKPEVNDAYFEANTDSRLNSGTWIPSWGKWINTIATDTPDLMQWDTTEGANADNMAYPTATAWGWDYGYTVSGHPSVTTDKFSASISNDGYVLTIYKGSNVFATYKAAKH